jgi:hypothetical protein
VAVPADWHTVVAFIEPFAVRSMEFPVPSKISLFHQRNSLFLEKNFLFREAQGIGVQAFDPKSVS